MSDHPSVGEYIDPRTEAVYSVTYDGGRFRAFDFENNDSLVFSSVPEDWIRIWPE